MLQFIAGFVVAGLISIGVSLLIVRRKSVKLGRTDSGTAKQLEDLGRLTGELAHEIKNPLSTIKVNLKLAGEQLAEGEKQNELGCSRALRKIGVIEKETDRLEQILDGFLRYLDGGEPIFADVDANSLVSDMIDFYSPQCHSHSITVRQGLYAGELVCKIDVDMLKQAILNIFINAQQAMSDGGELIIRTDKYDNCAVINISDTGTGIASDKISKIFDAYYSSRPKGSGLGLPTAKKIVETHDGSISVESEPGKGTSFTIKLPLSGKKESEISA